MEITRPLSKQPLPEHAKRVFKGQVFDVYQWEQQMFDGSVEIFEKIKRADTVCIFPILENGKILLTRQEQPGKNPFVGAAGGRINSGENVIDAARRELLEETGYQASTFTLWKSIQPISKIEWAVYILVAKGLTKTSELNLDPGEKIELLEVSFEEFLKVAMQENFSEKEIYRDVVEATIDKSKREQLHHLLS